MGFEVEGIYKEKLWGKVGLWRVLVGWSYEEVEVIWGSRIFEEEESYA